MVFLFMEHKDFFSFNGTQRLQDTKISRHKGMIYHPPKKGFVFLLLCVFVSLCLVNNYCFFL